MMQLLHPESFESFWPREMPGDLWFSRHHDNIVGCPLPTVLGSLSFFRSFFISLFLSLSSFYLLIIGAEGYCCV